MSSTGRSENQVVTTSSAVSVTNLTPVDEAAARAADVFARYDAILGQQDNARKNPYPFAIVTSASASISNLVPNSYLFVKEPGQRWRMYHINIINGQKEKILKDINEIAGLEDILNANAFNEDIYEGIENTIDAAKMKDEIVK